MTVLGYRCPGCVGFQVRKFKTLRKHASSCCPGMPISLKSCRVAVDTKHGQDKKARNTCTVADGRNEKNRKRKAPKSSAKIKALAGDLIQEKEQLKDLIKENEQLKGRIQIQEENATLLAKENLELRDVIHYALKSANENTNVMTRKNIELMRTVTTQAQEISRLKADLANSRRIEVVDMLHDEGDEDEDDSDGDGDLEDDDGLNGMQPAKKSRTDSASSKSRAALFDEQATLAIMIKEEAMERADTAEKEKEAVIKIKQEAIARIDTAEREKEVALKIKQEAMTKVDTAEREKEAALLKLECPYCFETDQDESYALVPCGHVMCSGCTQTHVGENCPTCRVGVRNRLRLHGR